MLIMNLTLKKLERSEKSRLRKDPRLKRQKLTRKILLKRTIIVFLNLRPVTHHCFLEV